MWTKICWFAEVSMWVVIGVFLLKLVATVLETL